MKSYLQPTLFVLLEYLILHNSSHKIRELNINSIKFLLKKLYKSAIKLNNMRHCAYFIHNCLGKRIVLCRKHFRGENVKTN